MSWNNLGLAYSDVGSIEKAVVCYQKGLECDPTDFSLLNNLGNYYSGLGQLAKAKTHFEKAMKFHPTEALTWNNLGWMSLKQDQLDEAKYYLEKAWELSNGEMDTVPINLGHVYLLQENTVAALDWYKKSVPLYESRATFLADMEGDYAFLKMEEKGVSRASFDRLVERFF